jgi:hypothetical protein
LGRAYTRVGNDLAQQGFYLDLARTLSIPFRAGSENFSPHHLEAVELVSVFKCC